MAEEEQRPTAPQTCCSGSATTAFMISGTYCFTSTLHVSNDTCHSVRRTHICRLLVQRSLSWAISKDDEKGHLMSSKPLQSAMLIQGAVSHVRNPHCPVSKVSRCHHCSQVPPDSPQGSRRM